LWFVADGKWIGKNDEKKKKGESRMVLYIVLNFDGKRG